MLYIPKESRWGSTCVAFLLRLCCASREAQGWLLLGLLPFSPACRCPPVRLLTTIPSVPLIIVFCTIPPCVFLLLPGCILGIGIPPGQPLCKSFPSAVSPPLTWAIGLGRSFGGLSALGWVSEVHTPVL